MHKFIFVTLKTFLQCSYIFVLQKVLQCTFICVVIFSALHCYFKYTQVQGLYVWYLKHSCNVSLYLCYDKLCNASLYLLCLIKLCIVTFYTLGSAQVQGLYFWHLKQSCNDNLYLCYKKVCNASLYLMCFIQPCIATFLYAQDQGFYFWHLKQPCNDHLYMCYKKVCNASIYVLVLFRSALLLFIYLVSIISIIKRLAITLMLCNRLRALWSSQSRLASLLFTLIARQRVELQTLWWFQLKDLSINEMVGAWCAHWGLHVGFLLLRYSVLCTVESLSLLCLLFISWFICSRRWCMDKVGGLSCKPNIYVSWSTSELRMRLVPWNGFKHSSKIFFTDRSKAVTLLWIICAIYALCFSRLFIGALWSPSGKGLTSWLLFVMFNCVIVTFPCGILCQVWYLIVSIPIFATFLTYICDI